MSALFQLRRAQMGAQGGGGGAEYIVFADPAVEAVLMANGVSSDGVGITYEDAAAVTSIGTWFRENTEITSFDEFEYFTGVTNLGTEEWNNWAASFFECSSLTSIVLPQSVKNIGYCVFTRCANLRSVNLESVERAWASAFQECTSLEIDVIMPNAKYLGNNLFYGTKIKRALNLGAITSLPGGWGATEGVFRNCTEMRVAIIPSTVTAFGIQTMAGCTSLEAIVIKNPTPPTFGGSALSQTNNCPLYVPDGSVDAYKGATGWLNFEARLKGISALQTDNPTLYEEIKDYL